MEFVIRLRLRSSYRDSLNGYGKEGSQPINDKLNEPRNRNTIND
jgi:hypothetical protein